MTDQKAGGGMVKRARPEVTGAHLSAADRVLSPLAKNPIRDRIALAIAYAEQRGRDSRPQERIAEARLKLLERRLRVIVDSWERWTRGDLMEEEFTGTITETQLLLDAPPPEAE